MADFPYITNTAKIKTLLGKMKSSGIPGKITLKTLSAWGLKSTNDRPLLVILKFIGFVDSSGIPTKSWNAFRSDKTSGAVLAQAIRSSYSSLFQLYPDAHQKDNEALRHFFSTNTTVGASTLEYMVRTFKTLCESADSQAEPVNTVSTAPHQTSNDSRHVVTPAVSAQGAAGLMVNVNIQLTLPATDNATIYENLFAAMKKHLLS